MNAKEFIQKHNLKISFFVPIDKSKWWEEQYRSAIDHFLVVITKNAKIKDYYGEYYLHKAFTTYFSQGLGHRHASKRLTPPKLESVVESLALDCSGIDMKFEEWADNLGYDQDSIKALNTYNTCRKISEDLKEFLGDEGYEELLQIRED